VPWVISNPIYVAEQRAGGEVLPRIPAAKDVQWQYENGPAPSWRVEKSPESQGVLDVVPTVGGTQLSIRYAIGGTRSENPYAAVAMPAATGLSGFDRLMFTARANRPMRLSVQVRVPGESQEQRWHRSVYLDETARPIVVMFDDMTPRGPTSSTRPDLVAVRDVLFVVDTANARPGTNGQLWLDDVGYGR